MKLILLVALIFRSTVSFGAGDLRDLMFFADEGQFLGVTSYNSSSTQYDLGSTDIESTTQTIEQTFYYIFSKGQAFGFSLERGKRSTEYDYATASDDTFESSGFRNPELYYVQRLMWQESDEYNVDFRLTLSPDLIKSERATSDDDGNLSSGSLTISADFVLGKKFGTNEFRIVAGAELEGEGKSESATSGDETTTSATNNFSLSASFQQNINEKFSYTLSLHYTMVDGYEQEDEDGDIDEYDSYNYFGYSGELKYLFKQNLMLRAGIAFTTPVEISYDSDSNGSGEIEDVIVSVFNLSGSYTF